MYKYYLVHINRRHGVPAQELNLNAIYVHALYYIIFIYKIEHHSLMRVCI